MFITRYGLNIQQEEVTMHRWGGKYWKANKGGKWYRRVQSLIEKKNTYMHDVQEDPKCRLIDKCMIV